MVLTCLHCGTPRAQRDETLMMNERAVRLCEGRCGGATRHIAGLSPEYVHMTPVPLVLSHNASRAAKKP